MFTSFVLIGALFGCDFNHTSSRICKNNPELCADLHKDSWCKKEKEALIQTRYQVKQQLSPQGKTLYTLLLKLEDYNQCMAIASQVQHILHTNRTQERAKAYSVGINNLEQLQQQTRGSNDLYLAYYHWARFSDPKARDVVLNAEEEGRITDPYLLARVATYYEKFNPEKSRELYFSALRRADKEQVDPNWLLGLAKTSRMEDNLPKAYLFTRANVLLSNNKVSEKQMSLLVNGDEALMKELDRDAEKLADAISKGKYRTSRIRTQVEKF